LAGWLTQSFFKGKTVRLVNLSLAGYKQPQQQIVLSYYLSIGQKFDLVIDLSGVNELLHSAVNAAKGIPFSFPNNDIWGNMGKLAEGKGGAANPSQILALWHQTKVSEALEEKSGCNFAACYLYKILSIRYHHWRYTKLNSAGTIKQEEVEWSYFVPTGQVGKASSEWWKETQNKVILKLAADFWEIASITTGRMIRDAGGKYILVLQPAPYAPQAKRFPMHSKTYTSDYAWLVSPIQNGYPFLLDRVGSIKKSGITIVDATRAFDQWERTPYKDDCCHLTEDGYRKLTRVITNALME